MARQLTLLPASKNWQLDAKTKETGKRGIAAARAALRSSKPSDTAKEAS